MTPSSATWTMEIRRLDTARVKKGTEPLMGTGGEVVRSVGKASRVHVEGNSTTNPADFVVAAWSPSGRKLLVHATEAYDGRLQVPPDTLYFEIQARESGS